MLELTPLATNPAWILVGLLATLHLALRAQRHAAERHLREVLQGMTRLHEQQARLLTVCRSAGYSLWTLAPDHEHLEWHTDAGPEDQHPDILSTWLQQFTDEAALRLSQSLSRCSLQQSPVDLQVPLLNPNESGDCLHVGASAVVDAQGQLVRIEGRCRLIDARSADVVGRLDTLTLPAWITDRAGHIAHVNPNARAVTGYADELPEAHWVDCIEPDDRSAWQLAVGEASESGQSFVHELRLRTLSAGYRWHLVAALPVSRMAERVRLWCHFAIDIDARKRSTDDNTALARRMTAMFEHLSDAFVLLDRDWRVLFSNAEASRMLSLPPGPSASSLWTLTPSLCGTPFERELRRAVQQDRSGIVESLHLPSNRVFEFRTQPSQEALAVYIRDVTEQRSREVDLRLLDAAVARLNDMVIITDAEPSADGVRRIVFVNKAFEERTGYPFSEIIGNTSDMLFGPETRRETLREIDSAMHAWQPLRTEVALHTRNGDPLWVEIDMVPLTDDSGWYTHWVAVLRDISERHRQRLISARRLQDMNRLGEEFSTEFNNLLTFVLGQGELLLDDIAGLGRQRVYAHTMLKDLRQGAILVRRFLAFTRKLDLSPERVDLRHYLAALLPTFEVNPNVVVDVQPDSWGDVPLVLIDPHALSVAMRVLWANALNAMPAGGTLSIDLHPMADDSGASPRAHGGAGNRYVRLRVTDTGCGMDSETLERLLQPFSADRRHSGLGIASLCGFLRQSDGYIRIDSAPARGTQVELFLPRANAASLAAPDIPIAPSAALGGTGTILLVEDDCLLRENAAEHLVRLGYQVLVAENCAQAVALARSSKAVNLMLVEVGLNGAVSVEQLATQVRQHHPAARLLYTGSHQQRERPAQLGYALWGRFIAKPYRSAQLARAVSDSLSCATP